MKKVAIVSAFRSAIGSFGGSLKDINIAELGHRFSKLTLQNKQIPADVVDEVILATSFLLVTDKILHVKLLYARVFQRPLLLMWS